MNERLIRRVRHDRTCGLAEGGFVVSEVKWFGLHL